MIPEGFTAGNCLGAAVGVFLLGVAKGGVPITPLVLPFLIFIWPENAVGEVVGFMLPLLCMMDVVALCFYRKHILWKRLLPLLGWGTLGIALTSIFLAIFKDAAASDRILQVLVGSIGVLFSLYQFLKKKITAKLEDVKSSRKTNAFFGISAGITSTIAHAAGPVASMYFLRLRLPKMNYAATMIGFFWGLNLIKLPFFAVSRITAENLKLALISAPLIPFGVGTGFLIVKTMKPESYLKLIYSLLFIAGVVLIYKGLFPPA